jgi:hypothetical protein
LIAQEYPKLIKTLKRQAKKSGSYQNKGKHNIQFLLQKKVDERRDLCHGISTFLIKESEIFQAEARNAEKRGNLSRGNVSKERHFNSAAFKISCAYNNIITALLLETCFVVSPRVSTWTMFKYYDSISSKNEEYPSITYHKHKNRFEMYCPLYGPNPLNPNETVRYLKNSEGENTVPIKVLLPIYLSPLFKKFLAIRND